jgi:hypothetical protein
LRDSLYFYEVAIFADSLTRQCASMTKMGQGQNIKMESETKNNKEAGNVSGLFTHTYLLICHMIERTTPPMFVESPGRQRLVNNGQRAASIYRLPSHIHL